MKKSQKTSEPHKRGPKHPRETLKERVHRHLNDINSKITDEDIRNVRTELEIRGETTPQHGTEDSGETKKQKRAGRKQKKENEIDTDKKEQTPWDILSQGYD